MKIIFIYGPVFQSWVIEINTFLLFFTLLIRVATNVSKAYYSHSVTPITPVAYSFQKELPYFQALGRRPGECD
jgi:hypothetical protein